LHEGSLKMAFKPARASSLDRATGDTEEEAEQVDDGASDQAEGDGVVRLGNQTFVSRNQLTAYFGHLLHTSHLEVPLDEEDAAAVIDLILLGHPKASQKLQSGYNDVVVSMHPHHTTNCFFLVRPDGSREDFSYRKCVNGLVHRFHLDDRRFMPDKSPRVGTLMLQRMLSQGPKGEERAWRLFDDMMDRQEANEYHAAVLLKNCSSTKQRMHLARMQKQGLKPTVVTYTTMMGRLMLEGKYDAASAMEAQMVEQGIQKNQLAYDVMADTDLDLKRLRELVRLQGYGQDGKDHAWEIFDRMCELGELNQQHVNVMMQSGISASEQKDLMSMLADVPGLQPDLITYGSLVSSLMFEGEVEEALDVVRKQWASFGETMEGVATALAKDPSPPNNTLYTMQRLILEAGDKDLENVWLLWDEMLTYGDASTVDFGVIVQACADPKELQHLASTLSESVLHDIMDTSPYCDFVQMLLEEDDENAHAGVQG